MAEDPAVVVLFGEGFAPERGARVDVVGGAEVVVDKGAQDERVGGDSAVGLGEGVAQPGFVGGVDGGELGEVVSESVLVTVEPRG